MKLLLKIIGALAVLGALVVAYLFFNLNHIVSNSIETVGSKLFQTEVAATQVKLSPFSGYGSVGLTIANPQGFTDGDAIALQNVEVSVDLKSLLKDVVIIHQITIDGTKLNFELKKGLFENNFKALQNNLKKSLNKVSSQKAPQSSDSNTKTTSRSDSSAKKVIIERFELLNSEATVTADVVGTKTVKVPNLVLNDIGKKKNGILAAEAAEQIFGKVTGKVVEAAATTDFKLKTDEVKAKIEEKAKGLLDKLSF